MLKAIINWLFELPIRATCPHDYTLQRTGVETGKVEQQCRLCGKVKTLPPCEHPEWEHDDFVWKETCTKCGMMRRTSF